MIIYDNEASRLYPNQVSLFCLSVFCRIIEDQKQLRLKPVFKQNYSTRKFSSRYIATILNAIGAELITRAPSLA